VARYYNRAVDDSKLSHEEFRECVAALGRWPSIEPEKLAPTLAYIEKEIIAVEEKLLLSIKIEWTPDPSGNGVKAKSVEGTVQFNNVEFEVLSTLLNQPRQWVSQDLLSTTALPTAEKLANCTNAIKKFHEITGIWPDIKQVKVQREYFFMFVPDEYFRGLAVPIPALTGDTLVPPYGGAQSRR